ncbi:MAG TPA: hydroxymethylglutaryl-CoA reductase, degradative [Sandaracinaceae bacterium LLY-WYZ-13_1]|nr:hydroxymethylglutaryl-CoA reductase, degradative [Sandaracinaceae bacterium LLY-WYZ-13_1]
MTSAIPRFYRLSMTERRARLASAADLTEAQARLLSPEAGLAEGQADRMVENAVGVFGLPLGVCVNLRVDGEDVLLPMAVEEPSVIAACSYAAKLLRAGGGITSEASDPIVVGQIQVLEVPDADAAERAVLDAEPELLALADAGHPRLVRAGGGARAIEVRRLPRERADDPCGDMLVLHLAVDVRDAMGANAINSMCERLAPRVAELTGGRVGLRILSNLTDRRTVTVTGRVPFAALEGKGAASGETLAKRIEEASVFAERDPYRACTHNKGIMNGVDAALIALGQDWRAVEAGAHAHAARDGRYGAMARWRVVDGHLVGRMTIPLAVGTVGGVAKTHPLVAVNRQIAGLDDAARLAAVCASAGLAQNLGALRALAAEGIQRGHMRLHARNVAVEAGAAEHEVLEVATRIADLGEVNARAAARVLAELRGAPGAQDDTAGEAPAHIEASVGPAPRPPTPPTRILAPFGDGPGHGEDGMGREEENVDRDFGGKVLVTGAAGHLGANLVRRLLDEGRDVRVLLRRGSNNDAVEGLDVERVYGDLREPTSLRPAVDGCETVFHAAAQLSTVEPNPEIERLVYECNVLGTRNLLREARTQGVERVVVTGSFSAVGYDLDDPEAPGHEDMPHWPFEEVLPYARTKVLVEHEALKACVEGLDVVIATSCAILGPHDHKPSRMGKTLMDFAHGKMPAYIPGGFDFVAARDIVDGHVRAMRRGRTGQKYIISTRYLEVDELMAIFEEVSGQPRPRMRLPGAVMAPVAEVSSFVLGNFFPKVPQRLTPAAVRILRKRRRADTSKAQRELGYRPTSIRAAIHEAYADFARRGLVPARAGTTEPPATLKQDPPRAARAATGS